jgi:hypothetical protein
MGRRFAPPHWLHPGYKSAFFSSDVDTLISAARLKQ